MRLADHLVFSWRSLWFARVRSLLSLFAMSIGVAAVVVLTWLGESARGYIAEQFQAIGAHLLIVLPGRTETTGGLPPLLSATPRYLTIDDALALRRSPHVRLVAPLAFGTAPLSQAGKERECPILGTTPEMLEVRHLTVAQGKFLNGFDPHDGASICVVGARVREELFGNRTAIGQWVRIGDRRFRLIGVLESMGTSIGLDIDDCVLIPVADALSLFNRPSLFRVLVQARSREVMSECERDIRRIITARHSGEEDVTVIRQDAVTGTFDRILGAVTLAVAGIAMISLIVAGILIMNVMVISVAQRRAEIGLLKALGARSGDIRFAFVGEAAMLSLLGALLGVGIGQVLTEIGRSLYPALHGPTPAWAIALAVGTAMITGVVFGVLPAQRAARLDPVLALSRR